MRVSLVAFLLLPTIAWGQARVEVPSIVPDVLKGAPAMSGAPIESPPVSSPAVAPASPVMSGKVGEGVPLRSILAAAPLAKDVPASPVTAVPPIKVPPVIQVPSLTVAPLDATSTGAPKLTSSADVAADITRWAAERKRQADERKRQIADSKSHAHTTAPQRHELPQLTLAPLGARPDVSPEVAAVPAPGISAPGGPPAANSPPVADSGCSADGDLQKLLSAPCLATLRSLHAPDGLIAGVPSVAAVPLQPAPEAQPTGVRCTVAVLASGGSPSQFAAESLEQCLVVGARMGYGVPGVTNIVASTPGGIVSVSCRRPPPDGTQVSCEAQQ
jgi:hypothetical protein